MRNSTLLGRIFAEGEKNKRKKERSCKIARSQILHFATEFQTGLNFTCQPNHKSSASAFILPPVEAPEFQIRSNFTWQLGHRIPHPVRFYLATRPQNSTPGQILPGNQTSEFHTSQILPGNQTTEFHTRSDFTCQPAHKIPHQVKLYLANRSQSSTPGAILPGNQVTELHPRSH